MTKCYYCGKTDGSHDISCICGKPTPPAMNAASPTDLLQELLDEYLATTNSAYCQADADDVLVERVRAVLAVPVGQDGTDYAAPVDNSAACSGFANSESAGGSQGSETHHRAPTADDPLGGQRWSKEADMLASWSGSATSGEIESIASNHDAMIILTQSYPKEAVIRVVDAHVRRQVRAALAAKAEQSNSAGSALDADMGEVLVEVSNARANWPPFNSAHEGFAVLFEEVDELKAHVWTNQKRRDLPAMRKEAMQVAAMALRFMGECCDETTGRK